MKNKFQSFEEFFGWCEKQPSYWRELAKLKKSRKRGDDMQPPNYEAQSRAEPQMRSRPEVKHFQK